MEEVRPILWNEDPPEKTQRIICEPTERYPDGYYNVYPYVEHSAELIHGFFGPYFFLSNKQKCFIPDREVSTVIYLNTECAYQASKFSDKEIRKQFVDLSCEKAIGKVAELAYSQRETWMSVRLVEMERVLRIKFHHSALAAKLKATGSKDLREDNHWKDIFWGFWNGAGENNLGKILMNIRSEI
jgi:predicted NAD-dependent protein-ADP-ribosyltransferase YbiA (DUF1768 family)